jgi:hypothetical protein
MSKPRINTEEMEEIRSNEAQVSELLSSIEKSKQFHIGDYLIRFTGDNKKAEQNSYHIDRRFQVVHVDVNGCCYIKEMMGSKSSSWIMSMASFDAASNAAYYTRSKGSDDYSFRYELDPLYEDHIIMQQEGKYDPSAIQKDKSKLHKEITAHNKALKVKMDSDLKALVFMKTLKVGDTLWFSNVTSFIVQEIKPLPKTIRINSNINVMNDPLILGVTNKGKNLKLSIYDFFYKAVYTGCPRTYKELKT